MSQKESFRVNRLVSLTCIVGAILVFALILYVAYLPGRPPPINYKIAEARKQNADEARAAGLAKITGYEVIDKKSGLVRIPIEEAMNLTVMEYNDNSKGLNN